LIGDYEDTTASTKYGVRFQVAAGSNDSNAAELLAQATEGVIINNAPVVLTDITISNAEFDMWEVGVGIGDFVGVRIDHGRIQMKGPYRITDYEWNALTTKFTLAAKLV